MSTGSYKSKPTFSAGQIETYLMIVVLEEAKDSEFLIVNAATATIKVAHQ